MQIVEIEEPSAGYGDGPAAVLKSWREAYQGTSSDAGDDRPAFQQWAQIATCRANPRTEREQGWNRLIEEFRREYMAGQEDEEWLQSFTSLISDDSDSDESCSSSDESCSSSDNEHCSSPDDDCSSSSDGERSSLSDQESSSPPDEERSSSSDNDHDSQTSDSEHSSDDEDDVRSMRSDYWDYLDEIVRNSLLFVTESGKFGFGPMNMTAGDHVWILGGCRWPLVMRPKCDLLATLSAGCRDFEFKGECFMNDLMNGEGTEGRLHEQVTVRLH